VRVQERILHHVLGILGVVQKPADGVEEPILVAADQLSERRRAALQTFSDEPVVVGTHVSCTLGRRRAAEGSRNARPCSCPPRPTRWSVYDATAACRCQKKASPLAARRSR